MSELALKPKPTLEDLQSYVKKMTKERGFDDDTVAMRFMLLIEEVGEFARAARKHAGIKFASNTATAELSHEAADVFLLLLVLCNQLGIDLEQAFREKEDHNKKRTWE